VARLPLLPPLWRVHPPPRSSPSISCRVHKLVVNLVRLPHLMYYSGRINTYKLDWTTVTVAAPRILAMSTSPASTGASPCASVAAASSVAAAAGSVLPSATGGWRVICAKSSSTVGARLRLPPNWLPHCVPIAFVALLNGVGRRHLLQARELRRQHTTSRHKYSTTLFKTAYFLGRGLW
jgi:hypothetical protein